MSKIELKPQVNVVSYAIAGLVLQIHVHGDLDMDTLLPTFLGFKVSTVGDLPVVSKIDLRLQNVSFQEDNHRLLSDISESWGDSFRLYEKDGQYVTLVRGQKADYIMYSDDCFNQIEILLSPEDATEDESHGIINWFLMVIFAQAGLLHQTIIFHASVVERDGEAYAFLGRSGTGKSTHSRLWLNCRDGFRLLNDDNPAVRVTAVGVQIFGTPWSGKTPCYRNEMRELKAFVRLQQAPQNSFSLKAGKEALLTLLPSCSALRWNPVLFSAMTGVVADIVAKVPIGELHCLPDCAAAQLCYTELNKL